MEQLTQLLTKKKTLSNVMKNQKKKKKMQLGNNRTTMLWFEKELVREWSMAESKHIHKSPHAA